MKTKLEMFGCVALGALVAGALGGCYVGEEGLYERDDITVLDVESDEVADGDEQADLVELTQEEFAALEADIAEEFDHEPNASELVPTDEIAAQTEVQAQARWTRLVASWKQQYFFDCPSDRKMIELARSKCGDAAFRYIAIYHLSACYKVQNAVGVRRRFVEYRCGR